MFIHFLYENFPLYAPDDGAGTGGDDAGTGDEAGKTDAGTKDGDGAKSILDLAKTGDDTATGGDDDTAQGGGDTLEGGDGKDTLKGGDADDPAKINAVDALVFKEKPDWLPEPFFDKESGKVNVEALAKSQNDLRAKLGAQSKAPAKPEDYKFELEGDGVDKGFADAAKVVLLDGEKDPLLVWFRGEAHERGISQENAKGLLEGFVKAAHEMMPPMPEPVKELAALGKNGEGMATAFEKFRVNLENTGVLTAEEAGAVKGWFLTAADMTAFQKIREWYGEKQIPYTASVTSGAKTPEDLRAAQASLTKEHGDKKITDADFNAKMEALQLEYEKTYGTEPAGTSRVS